MCQKHNISVVAFSHGFWSLMRTGQIKNDGAIDPVRLVKVLEIIGFSSRMWEIERRRHLKLNEQRISEQRKETRKRKRN